MVESGTATDSVLKYAHWFVLQHSIASDIESLFVDVRRWDQAARQDGDEGDSVLHGWMGWRREGSVPAFRISPSCRTNTMPTVATIFRGRSDA
jgi:hypothetical protein